MIPVCGCRGGFIIMLIGLMQLVGRFLFSSYSVWDL